jgi:hypothetical protein
MAAAIMSFPSSSEEKHGDEDLIELHLGLYWYSDRREKKTKMYIADNGAGIY